MKVRVACVAVALAACHHHRGAAVEPPSNGGGGGTAAAPSVVMHLEQGPCMGMCPVYTLDLYDDGTLVFHGDSNVVTKGEARGKLDDAGMKAVAAVFAEGRFFELGEDGMVMDPKCQGANTICGGSLVMCTDTPHTTITYTVGGKSKTLDDAHCQETDLSRLEGRLAPLLPTMGWVGGGE